MRKHFLLLIFVAIASGQTGFVQLPLSGRGSQGGSVNATQTPVPGTTSSVNTLNTTVQTMGPYTGSASSTARTPFSGKLGFREAIERGLEFNLGVVGFNQAVRQAQGQARVARSVLLPNLSAGFRDEYLETNLRALGIRVPFLPAIAGPFNYMDLRATLTQTVADFTALNNVRATREIARANEQSVRDARDLITLAVGGAYLQAVAAKARVESERAQIATAEALFKQASDRRQAGLAAQIEVNQSRVQLQIQQQRLATLENDFAKQKINLARLTGIPPNDHYELAEDVAYSEAPAISIEDALKEALTTRADLAAAETQVKAAERARTAARAERLPTVALSADYGVIGQNPAQVKGTFTLLGTVKIPIWQGGRASGEILQADAALDQRRAEVEDTRSRIESDVRNAFLDLTAAASQLEVSRNNQQVSRETLRLTRERYEAGVTDAVEVVQSQASVASADLDFITSLFAHNLAKLSLARALGKAETRVSTYLKIQ